MVENSYSHLFIFFSSQDDRCDSLQTSDRKGSTSESQVWSYFCFSRLLRLQENTSVVYICSYLVSPTVRSFCNLLAIFFETFRWNNHPSWLTNNFTGAIFLLWTNSNFFFFKKLHAKLKIYKLTCDQRHANNLVGWFIYKTKSHECRKTNCLSHSCLTGNICNILIRKYYLIIQITYLII